MTSGGSVLAARVGQFLSAIDILKPGMDTKTVVARFESGRQALALMDHPNIAKVLDVGSTPAGRPYFVMELVRGVSITEYCDESLGRKPAGAGMSPLDGTTDGQVTAVPSES